MPSASSSFNSASAGSAYSAATGRDPSVAASSAAPSRPATQRSPLPSSGHPLASMRDTLGGRASASRMAHGGLRRASVSGRRGPEPVQEDMVSDSIRHRFLAGPHGFRRGGQCGGAFAGHLGAKCRQWLRLRPGVSRPCPCGHGARSHRGGESIRAGGESASGTGSAGSRPQTGGDLCPTPALALRSVASGFTASATSRQQEPGNLYPVSESMRRSAADHFSATGSVQREEPAPSVTASAPRSAMKGSRSAAGSAGGSTRTVNWRDDHLPDEVRTTTVTRTNLSSRGGTYQDPEATSVVSRAFLNDHPHDVHTREEESRRSERTPEASLSRRQDSYMRGNAGTEYSLGRLTYLSMAGPGDESQIAAMTTSVRQASITANHPEGLAIDLDSLPSHVVSMVESIQLPVEPGSALSEAISRSRAASAAASAAVSVAGSQSDGGDLLHEVDHGFDSSSAIGSARPSFSGGR